MTPGIFPLRVSHADKQEVEMKSLKLLVVLSILLSLGGCGVETATTAATGAVIKKNEMEEGKKTMERSQAKVQDAVQQMQERAEKDGEK